MCTDMCTVIKAVLYHIVIEHFMFYLLYISDLHNHREETKLKRVYGLERVFDGYCYKVPSTVSHGASVYIIRCACVANHINPFTGKYVWESWLICYKIDIKSETL